MISGLIALAFAAAFAGAAVYVNWVEQPARMALDEEALLSEWRPSDSRGVALLAAFALAGAVAGFIAYFESEDVRWVFGALIIISSWPYAFFVMAPLNNQILSLRGRDVAAARALVRQWGLVESGFAAIGVLAVAMFLWAL
jgi:Anthrone oxygenase